MCCALFHSCSLSYLSTRYSWTRVLWRPLSNKESSCYRGVFFIVPLFPCVNFYCTFSLFIILAITSLTFCSAYQMTPIYDVCTFQVDNSRILTLQLRALAIQWELAGQTSMFKKKFPFLVSFVLSNQSIHKYYTLLCWICAKISSKSAISHSNRRSDRVWWGLIGSNRLWSNLW